MITRFLLVTMAGGLMAVAQPIAAAINVFACEPEWGALVTELAGDNVKLYVATTAMQNVHHIQARPSLLAAVRRANLVVCTGAELEAGWLPILIRESGNATIQRGQPGTFEAARHASMIDIPVRIDRSEGDVHSMGNPHVHTDPRNIPPIAAALARQLALVDPGNAQTYRTRLADFDIRWRNALSEWTRKAVPLRGTAVIEHHRSFSYFFNWSGVKVVGYLEPKPGVEPSTGHLASLLERHKTEPAQLIVRASFNDPRASQWLAERAKIPAVMLPFSVGGNAASKDLFIWFDSMIDILLEAGR
ncbi:MAG: metal ABC transporter solute-binding protein, Zn/Mn family [Burkholderiales bacterium]